MFNFNDNIIEIVLIKALYWAPLQNLNMTKKEVKQQAESVDARLYNNFSQTFVCGTQDFCDKKMLQFSKIIDAQKITKNVRDSSELKRKWRHHR